MSPLSLSDDRRRGRPTLPAPAPGVKDIIGFTRRYRRYIPDISGSTACYK